MMILRIIQKDPWGFELDNSFYSISFEEDNSNLSAAKDLAKSLHENKLNHCKEFNASVAIIEDKNIGSILFEPLEFI